MAIKALDLIHKNQVMPFWALWIYGRQQLDALHRRGLVEILDPSDNNPLFVRLTKKGLTERDEYARRSAEAADIKRWKR